MWTGLDGVQLGVPSGPCQELLMGTDLHNLPLLQNHDPMSLPDGGEPVGDDEGGASLHQPAKCNLDELLRFWVQRTGGLIQ